MAEKQIVGGAPVFLVGDVGATVRYYNEKLGFRTHFVQGKPATYGIIERDDFSIHLFAAEGAGNRTNRSEQAPKANDVYVFVKDIDALHQELVASGADVLEAPQTWPYQMREFSVRDLNGYHLCFDQFVGEEES